MRKSMQEEKIAIEDLKEKIKDQTAEMEVVQHKVAALHEKR
jgi:hypothetical protein